MWSLSSTKYQVTQAPSFDVVQYNAHFSAMNYNLIVIPIDEHHILNFINGSLRIDHFNDEMTKRVVSQIQKEEFKALDGTKLSTTCFCHDSIIKVIFLGIGTSPDCQKHKEYFSVKMQKLGAKISDFAFWMKIEKTAIVSHFFSTPCTTLSHEKMSAMIAFGFFQKSYRFDRYMTTKKNKDKSPKITSLTLAVKNESEVKTYSEVLMQELYSIYLTRDLVNEPANIIFPKSYATIIKEQMSGLNIDVTVLEVSDLKKLGMNMLLGVGMGSSNEPCVVVMKYHGNQSHTENDIALVGKGVTFDSGGLSIKPSKAMEDMKIDMAGSAVVVSTMHLLARRKANVNAIGIVGLVENSINGIAQRPGDIVTSMSGQTVEVLNTDAEGRLVLGDILYYVVTKYKPRHVIDLATLTGAIVVALGISKAGIFSNSDDLAHKLLISGKNTGDYGWHMPLSEEYDKLIDSEFADVKNSTGSGYAGSATAAHFLQRFIADCKSWAHIDIAGVVGKQDGESPFSPKGATGYGVKLLNDFILNNIENASF